MNYLMKFCVSTSNMNGFFAKITFEDPLKKSQLGKKLKASKLKNK